MHFDANKNRLILYRIDHILILWNTEKQHL